MTNTIAIPAVSNFYKGVAAVLHGHIPGHFSSLEVIAASASMAQDLAGDSSPDPAHFRQAVNQYLAKLPDDIEEANVIIKTEAEKVLGIPGLAADYARLKSARAAVVAAELEVAQVEAEQGQRLARIHRLDNEIAEAAEHLQGWDLDFDGIEAGAEAVISDHFGDNSPGAAYSRQHIEAAFSDLSRVPVLRKLAPPAIAKLQARIDTAKASLALLHSPVAAAPEPSTPKRGRIELPATV